MISIVIEIKHFITLVLSLMFSDHKLAKMPRSNKKKTFLKPLPKLSAAHSVPSHNIEISDLLSNERNLMISRAITSARNHGIALKPGSSNPGTGDCSFESEIQNNNDRGCFSEEKNNVN